MTSLYMFASNAEWNNLVGNPRFLGCQSDRFVLSVLFNQVLFN